MTKKDLINYLETDDFVYINANGVYIGKTQENFEKLAKKYNIKLMEKPHES